MDSTLTRLIAAVVVAILAVVLGKYGLNNAEIIGVVIPLATWIMAEAHVSAHKK